MFTSVCLQFERELKWKLRTNNQCLIIISQHVRRLVFISLSVYCGRLILACVCYATAITSWCVLILNFCPSYFFFFFRVLVYLLLKCFPLYFESTLYLQLDPCESPNSEIVNRMAYQSHALSAALSFYSHFLPRAGGVLMSANSTPTLSQTCNYCNVYLYLKHCLTRKIWQYAANAFI